MESWVGFVYERTTVNIVPIIVGFVVGSTLVHLYFKDQSIFIKAIIAGFGGFLAGLISYSSADRSLEFNEALLLSIGMFGFPFLIGLIVFRSQDKK
jgi:hypothetical protein